ncbi:MAG TPA: hypothetical protein PK536_12205 [Ignavibacteria bacterium]|nr:hypothetical protein [Bacteroidota bacterium]HRI86198.1 hypothetical protein [Ignavibacteria bacterium]HRK00474.1 hypothetical protein [Ignavibacteria bacterium]
MNLLKNLFERRNGVTSNETDTQVITNEDNKEQFSDEIKMDVFKHAGAAEKKLTEKNSESEITKFLEYDFEKDGYNDGYDDPSKDILDSSLEKIKSDYIFIIEKKISSLNQKIMMLKEDSMRISGISATDTSLIESRISELRKLILRLIEEKEFAVSEKGSVQKALNNYISGFKRGVSDYTREKIFAPSTGMF